MNPDGQKNLRHHVVAAARDILVVLSVISVLGGAVAYATRPFWQPFADLPEGVALLQLSIAKVQASLTENVEPRIVDFQGIGLVVTEGPVRAGATIQVFYSLRRNASCETDITPSFFNVDRGITFQAPFFPSVPAPVTEQYQPFSVPIQLPIWLEPGRYVYYPLMTPKDCGVYKQIRVTPSQIFTVSAE